MTDTGLTSLLQRAKEQAGTLATAALAVDDYIGQWEDKVESRAVNKLAEVGKLAHQAVLEGPEQHTVAEAEAGLPPDATAEERLVAQRRKTREMYGQLDLEQQKVRQLDRQLNDLHAAVERAKHELVARDETIAGLDKKLAEYAELIPAWEVKQREEQEAQMREHAERQQHEIMQIQAICDERVADAQRELALERSAKSSLEFNLAQGFEARARAKDGAAELVDDELRRLHAIVPSQQAQIKRLETSLHQVREREQEKAKQAIDAEVRAANATDALETERRCAKRDAEVRAQLQRLVQASEERAAREQREAAAALAKSREQVQILKRVVTALRGADSGAVVDENAGEMQLESAERLLMVDLGHAKQEVVALRIAVSERDRQMAAVRTGWQKAKEVLATREQLVTQLEEQLAEISSSATSKASTTASPAETNLSSRAVPSTALAAGAEEKPRGESVAGRDAKLVEAISSQRDRLRSRVKDLEEELQQMHSAEHEAAQQLRLLKEDNVALSQKLRFVESYKGQLPGASRVLSSSNDRGGGRRWNDSEIGTGHNTVSHYVDGQGLDPFAEFAAQQQAAAESRLHVFDRAILDFSRGFLSSAASRRVVFVYVAILHLLAYGGLLARLAYAASTEELEER